jgi:hypothetical protein
MTKAPNNGLIIIGTIAIIIAIIFFQNNSAPGSVIGGGLFSVLQPGQVSFRTNATTFATNPGEGYRNASNKGKLFIAIDSNDDGSLECWKGNSYTTQSFANCEARGLPTIASSPEGFTLCIYPESATYNVTLMYYTVPSTEKYQHTFYKSTLCPTGFLSTSPTAPYTANNQETLVGGGAPACVTRTELGRYITQWIASTITREALGNYIMSWVSC